MSKFHKSVGNFWHLVASDYANVQIAPNEGKENIYYKPAACCWLSSFTVLFLEFAVFGRWTCHNQKYIIDATQSFSSMTLLMPNAKVWKRNYPSPPSKKIWNNQGFVKWTIFYGHKFFFKIYFRCLSYLSFVTFIDKGRLQNNWK